MGQDPEHKRTHAGGQRIIRCGGCGRADDCSVEDAMRYTQTGWPKCCGGVMTYFMEADRSAPDDTALDTPPLPPT